MTLPEDSLRTLISNVTKWQQLCGVTGELDPAAAAADYIVLFGEENPSELPRIYISSSGDAFEKTGTHTFRESGSFFIRLKLARDTDTYPTLNAEYVAVQTDMRELVRGIANASNTTVDGTPLIGIGDIQITPARIGEIHAPDYWEFYLRTEWPSP